MTTMPVTGDSTAVPVRRTSSRMLGFQSPVPTRKSLQVVRPPVPAGTEAEASTPPMAFVSAPHGRIPSATGSNATATPPMPSLWPSEGQVQGNQYCHTLKTTPKPASRKAKKAARAPARRITREAAAQRIQRYFRSRCGRRKLVSWWRMHRAVLRIQRQWKLFLMWHAIVDASEKVGKVMTRGWLSEQNKPWAMDPADEEDRRQWHAALQEAKPDRLVDPFGYGQVKAFRQSNHEALYKNARLVVEKFQRRRLNRPSFKRAAARRRQQQQKQNLPIQQTARVVMPPVFTLAAPPRVLYCTAPVRRSPPAPR
mmetsp:Transcript_20260/g.49659  ORF Transcript_20260/g.49659 Transcript_20260/m.49659 type:complete len:311 (-) Transcript_20260:41-973(-)